MSKMTNLLSTDMLLKQENEIYLMWPFLEPSSYNKLTNVEDCHKISEDIHVRVLLVNPALLHFEVL